MRRIAALSLCAALAGAGPARAESAFDLVFKTGTLDALPEGAALRYEGEGTPGPSGDEGLARVVVSLGPGERVLVEGGPAAGAARPLGTFDAGVGNPVAMLFLERTVSTVAEATGGSPFYIRNRMRDALAGPGEVEDVTVAWDGQDVAATAVELAPFTQDAHRAELGRFADLRIRVVVSPEVPGWYHSISADAPAAGAGDAFGASLSLAEADE